MISSGPATPSWLISWRTSSLSPCTTALTPRAEGSNGIDPAASTAIPARVIPISAQGRRFLSTRQG